MMFIELFVPRGALGEEQRRRLSGRLITEFMTEEEEESAPAAVIEAGYAIWQVVVHETDTWIVGGRALDPTEPPRYVVRVSVPGSWRKDMSAEIISRVTRVLAEADEDPQRLYREPHAWVHVVGIPEGSCGAFGRVMGSNDIVKLITKPFRESPDRDALIEVAAPGTAVDPICGMTVPLTDAAITSEHHGRSYAFCSPGCRAVFVEEQRAAG
ncbi:MAG: YHS domain-containing protein [Streptosporangiales bacterium]|nr:YHS domain-containing protein [Streptosporangiales bacterium]